MKLIKTLLSSFIFLMAPTADAAGVIKAACVGDSITQGVPYYNSNGNGCTNCGGYEPKLHTLLTNNGWTSTVYNYGIAGEFSDAGAQRIPGIIDSINPDYVLFMEGTNDLFYNSPNTVKENIRTGINNILTKGKTPIVGTLLPDTRGDNNNTKQIPATNDLIRALLIEMNVQLAELYNATSYSDWASKIDDGLHPNQSGYQLMADVWFAALSVPEPEPEPEPDNTFLPAIMLLLLD